ncbi:MAG: chromosomal replication initiator protein DnaA [Candidatus Omnitrophica bacterium]|nr:chromosomal replication initiator protein DnaA [Candidatus Omnitrophota bacterium]
MPVLSCEKLWSDALDLIHNSVNEQAYQTWFTPTHLSEIDKDKATVLVPNRFFADWLKGHYQKTIEHALGELVGSPVQVEYQSRPEQVQRPFIPRPKPIHEKAFHSSGLNPRYTFDSFVVGNNNRFAHAAAVAVTDSPARAYNPLFIHGRVGLGKTHLMQAIAHRVAVQNPEAHIVYTSSEQFTNQLIGAIQTRSTASFRKKYREVDVLLVDDIQFIAGKESTQEEFFHTFNALYDAHKQIVVSSDRSPKDIATMEERLVSRFEWGLITDIQQPDYETRMAILRKKCECGKVFVPHEVTAYIAQRIKTNIRELEGALIRVAAFAELTSTPVTIDLTKELLKDTFREEDSKLTIDLIQHRVADYFGVRFQDMVSKRRVRSIAYPRQVAMFLSRELTDHSLPSIGEHFGGRDHATVLHAYAKINNEVKTKPNMRELVTRLTTLIRGVNSYS